MVVRQLPHPGKKTSRPDDFFPFFGAGKVRYDEWAELVLRFRRAPTPQEQDRILQDVPGPLRRAADGDEDSGVADRVFMGRMLSLGSDQYVNMHIEQAYGDGTPGPWRHAHDEDDEEGADDRGEDDDERGLHDVSEAAATKFEAHIEAWLREVHTVCPIDFVCRLDDEGGTEFSAWHRQSLQAIDSLVMRWAADPGTLAMPQEEHERFQRCVGAIFDFGDVDLDEVPEDFMDAFFPERRLARWLEDPVVPLQRVLAFYDAQRARNAEQLVPVLGSGLAALARAGHAGRACDVIEHLLLRPDFLEDMGHLLGRIAYAILKADRPGLQTSFVALLCGRDERHWNRDAESCNYTNNIAGHATELMQGGEWALAIRMFDLALSIDSPRPPVERLEPYANALYALQNDNSKLPVDAELNRRFLAKALPLGPKNPAIFFNAACLYVEMNEFDEAVKMVKLAIRNGYDGLATMKSQFDKLPMFAAFRKHPAYLALRFHPGTAKDP